jgi:hypothetical protein
MPMSSLSIFTCVCTHPSKQARQSANDYTKKIHLDTSGLNYKRVTIVIDTPSVVKVMLQIVALLTIVIDDAS